MTESKILVAAAAITNLRAVGRHLFGRYRGHPVSITQQSALEGNRFDFQVLLAQEALPLVAAAIQDKGRVQAAGLKPASILILPDRQTLAYAHMPAVRAPKPEDVKAMLDGLTGLADSGGQALGERCEHCGAPAPRLRVVNGTPTQLCDADFQNFQAQFGAVSARVKAMTTDYAKGILFGLVAVFIGAFAWAGILIVSGYIFSLAAIAIALLIGYLILMGAGKPNYLLVGIMALFTIIAIVLGTVLWIAVEITRLGGPFDLGLAFSNLAVLAAEDPGALGSSIFFGLLGVFMGGSYMIRTTRRVTPRFEVIE